GRANPGPAASNTSGQMPGAFLEIADGELRAAFRGDFPGVVDRDLVQFSPVRWVVVPGPARRALRRVVSSLLKPDSGKTRQRGGCFCRIQYCVRAIGTRGAAYNIPHWNRILLLFGHSGPVLIRRLGF